MENINIFLKAYKVDRTLTTSLVILDILCVLIVIAAVSGGYSLIVTIAYIIFAMVVNIFPHIVSIRLYDIINDEPSI